MFGLTGYLMFLRPLAAWRSALEETTDRTMNEVRQMLGEPKSTLAPGGDIEAFFRGFVPVPKHPFSAEVWMYEHLNVRGYLFFNRVGRVEHVEFAGT